MSLAQSPSPAGCTERTETPGAGWPSPGYAAVLDGPALADHLGTESVVKLEILFLGLALGMSAGDANAEGWRGSREATLLQQGEEGTGMALLLGGEAASTAAWETGLFWSFVGEYGYYWSASEVKDNGLQTATVWFRKIGAHYTTVYRGAVTLQRLMRVRCCRDAGK